MPTIAIDFGTANTRVAVWQNGSIRILENENANRSTPGYVAFGENERFFGDAAKNQVSQQDPIILCGRKFKTFHIFTGRDERYKHGLRFETVHWTTI